MKKLVYIIIILLGIAGGTYWYVFHKPHRDLQNEEVAYSLQADELMQAFSEDQATADSLYVDQLISLEGIVESVEERALIIRPGIYGSLDSTATMPALKAGDPVKIRGRVLSFDELFEEVKMDYVQFVDK
ncbi:MAG: OB-fold putative lipoprotein [Bacteroidetes bacterium]|nr:OB-fold putative lipoprotein [Bacteroidota bacterium]